MSFSTHLRIGAAVAVLAGTIGCATARNYDAPSGPVLVGRHPSARVSASEIRLVTFNIKFGEHVDRAADLLSRPGPLQQADVVVLQEMDPSGTEALAHALGLSYVYVPSAVHPSSGRDFGVAILSPWPLADARKVPLPHEHRFRGLRRAAAVATVRVPAGPLRVYAVHLESPAGMWGRDRRDQARAILSDIGDWTGPVVVAGDFNGRSGADEVARAGFFWLTRLVHSDAWFYDFDHILVRGLCADAGPLAGVASDDTRASDHRPVWAVVRSCAPS